MAVIKVAIDSGPLESGHKVRGIGAMVRGQIEALEKEAKTQKDIKVFALDFTKEDLDKFDIVHYSYFFPYKLTLPSRKFGKRVIVTIQDLIQLVYPKHYPPGLRGKINFLRQKRRLKLADAIITISETSKKDIVRFLGIPKAKIFVTYLAPSASFIKISDKKFLKRVKEKYNLPDTFVLYVGDLNYNKNILGLIEACGVVQTPLVIVGREAPEVEDLVVSLKNLKGPRDWLRFVSGRPHPELSHFEVLAKEFRENKQIFRLGFVPESDLVAIYNLASVCVQPSFYEGLGLPVLEAMACGTPVVIAKTQSLVEIGGGACVVADPYDPKDFAGKILRLISDTSERVRLKEAGLKRAKEFSWEVSARKTIEVYKRVARTKN